MKTWLLITLGLGLLGSGAYYILQEPGESEIRSGTSGAGRGVPGAKAIVEFQEAKTQSIQETIADIPARIGGAAAGFAGEIKEQLRAKVAEILDLPTSTLPLPPGEDRRETETPEARTEDVPPGEKNQEPAPGSGGVQVCVSRTVGEKASYILKNPFSPNDGFTYRVAWGDAATIAGEVSAEESRTAVSHIYKNRGAYAIVFTITAPDGEVILYRNVCVE